MTKGMALLRRRPRGNAAGGGRSDPSKWLIFAIVSIALFMMSVDVTIVSTGLQTIRQSLHTQINWATWTVTAYELGLVVSMPISGRISDQLGRKKVFLVAAVVFVTASFLCGLANSIGVLIALRVVQAVGGAAFMPTASGLIADIFGKDKQRALGLFSSIFPLGALVGPVLGGILISSWSWRGIFLVNVPVGLLFTVLAAWYLPSSQPRGGRTDIAGALLLGGTVLSAMLAITRLGDPGGTPASVTFAIPFLLSFLLGWLFWWRSGRMEQPLIPMHLLRGKVFGAMNLINFLWGASAIGFAALVPLYAQVRYHISPLSSGTLLTARAIGEIALAGVTSFLLHRIGYRLPLIVGLGFIISGLVLLYVHPLVLGPYGWLAFAAGLTGIGIGISAPAANNATLEFSPNDIGAISGLRGATRQSGAIIGVAVTSAVVARSANEALTLGACFTVLAVILAAIVPLVLIIPDGARARRNPGGRRALSAGGATAGLSLNARSEPAGGS
jgi:EmrB/QacA subfamily drug resistance transporter